MFNDQTRKPLIDLSPDQRETIAQILGRYGLEEFQQYVEEVVLSGGNLALLVQLITSIYNKAQNEMRNRLLQLENMRMTDLAR